MLSLSYPVSTHYFANDPCEDDRASGQDAAFVSVDSLPLGDVPQEMSRLPGTERTSQVSLGQRRDWLLLQMLSL